jgi:hypothetical protein
MPTKNRSQLVPPDAAPVGQCAGSTRLYSARSQTWSCACVLSLFTFHFWNLEQSTSEEKAGIDPTYQTPFQEIATSPLPTPIAWGIVFL